MTHKSAQRTALKPCKRTPAPPPKVRREIVNMAKAAAAAISADNPQRDVILCGIKRLCRQWKVSLPRGWSEPK